MAELSPRWAFQPLRRVEPPVVSSLAASRVRNPIDRFILARLEAPGVGIAPSPEADPRTLIRRLHFDLVGLPPTPEDVAEFLRDPSDEAYEKLVDRLLASPRHGERWARHWLDVARYGESNGFEYNEARRNAWPYRDWVIDAIDVDLPYDRFVEFQIAGDVIDTSGAGAAAVGFLVAGVHNSVLGASELMKLGARQEELEEIVATVSQAFLGLTVHCARCHDHKFDPVPTEDYYRVAASLAGVWHGTRDIALPTTPHATRVTSVHTVESRPPGEMRVHLRGNAATLGEPVTPGGLSAIQGLDARFEIDSASSDAARRRALADWLTHSANPLPARVLVNRVWHHHFGVGLVATPSDLGANGARPSHPDLLDWLAVWFRDRGQSVKALHRVIVLSSSYRQSSRARESGLEIDAGNRLLWRFTPRRLEAESLRDAMLSVAGVLRLSRGGPGYEDVVERHFNAGRYYDPIDPGEIDAERRTIYRFSPRGGRNALLDAFDCPDPSVTAPRRARTCTPLQALSLLNNPLVVRAADRFARRVRRESGGSDPRAQLRRVWWLALARSPDAREEALALELLWNHGLEAVCRAIFNASEFVRID